MQLRSLGGTAVTHGGKRSSDNKTHKSSQKKKNRKKWKILLGAALTAVRGEWYGKKRGGGGV